MTLRTVVLEASHEAILTLNLNRLEGEDFDVIRHVVSYEDDGEVITIETCRTMEAFLAGELDLLYLAPERLRVEATVR